MFSIFTNETFVDLCLYQFGMEACRPLHSYGPYIRNHYLFHYILSGKGTLTAADSAGTDHTYTISAGKGFFIFPGQVTSYYADEKDPWTYMWLEFDGIKVREYLRSAGIDIHAPVFKPRSAQSAASVRDEMLYICDHSEAPPLCLIGHLYLFLNALITASARYTAPKENRLKDYYIREAIAYIEQHYQENMSVEDIAAACGLNRSYFGKIFKDATNMAPQEFIIHYRMTKAGELLKTSSLPVSAISALVGYQNPLHFSRAFKNFYKEPPSTWRIRHKS